MPELKELADDDEMGDFLGSAPVVLLTFSAHWCGPCKASKPRLKELAVSAKIPFGIVYEDDLGEAIHYFDIKAFPTYVVYKGAKEVERVEGADLDAVAKMVEKHSSQ